MSPSFSNWLRGLKALLVVLVGAGVAAEPVGEAEHRLVPAGRSSSRADQACLMASIS